MKKRIQVKNENFIYNSDNRTVKVNVNGGAEIESVLRKVILITMMILY
jgi:hypothetical protein